MSQFADEIDVEFRKWTAMMLEKKHAEITRLRAENEKLREQLRGEIESHQAMTKAYENEIKMLKEIREITRLRADLAAVTAERDRMREALRPFADAVDIFIAENHDAHRAIVTLGDFFHARAALEGVTVSPTG